MVYLKTDARISYGKVVLKIRGAYGAVYYLGHIERTTSIIRSCYVGTRRQAGLIAPFILLQHLLKI
jgi:hypothetical protein